MRPRGYRREVDPYLVRRGLIDRIALPGLKLIKDEGLKLFNAYRSIPEELLKTISI